MWTPSIRCRFFDNMKFWEHRFLHLTESKKMRITTKGIFFMAIGLLRILRYAGERPNNLEARGWTSGRLPPNLPIVSQARPMTRNIRSRRWLSVEIPIPPLLDWKWLSAGGAISSLLRACQAIYGSNSKRSCLRMMESSSWDWTRHIIQVRSAGA